MRGGNPDFKVALIFLIFLFSLIGYLSFHDKNLATLETLSLSAMTGVFGFLTGYQVGKGFDDE